MNHNRQKKKFTHSKCLNGCNSAALHQCYAVQSMICVRFECWYDPLRCYICCQPHNVLICGSSLLKLLLSFELTTVVVQVQGEKYRVVEYSVTVIHGEWVHMLP